MTSAVSEPLQSLYDDYYQVHDIQKKRALAAKDSVDHVQLLMPGNLGKLIDVGAGNGSVLKEVFHRNLATEATAVEISASGLEKIQALQNPKLKEVVQFDGYNIPFADSEFDTALCVHVMEHVEHERRLLKEMARVAKNIIVEVPLEGGMRGRANYSTGHINYYTPLSFRALLETTGLEVVNAKIFTSSKEYEVHLYGTAKGTIRNTIRNSLLSVFGNRATDMMTYLYAAHCRPLAA